MKKTEPNSPGANPGFSLDEETCRELSRTCAAFNLRRTNRLVTQAFDDALRPCGVKVTQFSLLAAAYVQGNLVLHKLARVLGMDRTTLSRNLKLLEKKGLVRLEKGRDQREVRVVVTRTGLETLEEARPLWEKAQTAIVQGLGEDKWRSMVKDLRLIGNLLEK